MKRLILLISAIFVVCLFSPPQISAQGKRYYDPAFPGVGGEHDPAYYGRRSQSSVQREREAIEAQEEAERRRSQPTIIIAPPAKKKPGYAIGPNGEVWPVIN